MVAYTKALAPHARRRILAFGSPDGGSVRSRTSPSCSPTTRTRCCSASESRSRCSSCSSSRATSTRGLPVEVYGYVTDPKPFLAPTFANIRGKSGERELAASRVADRRALPIDSILSISVTTLGGDEVYKSPGWVAPHVQRGRHDRAELRPAHHAREPQHGVRRQARRRRAAALAAARCSSRCSSIAAGLLTVALVQLRRQQELARLRTEFVSGVSHELRTPLAQIRWFAELLHMGKLRSEDERARSAGIIDQEARRLTYLVENVLNFSRGEKGANRISPAPADLDHEIRDALELFAPLARARKMTRRRRARRQRRRVARPRRASSDSAQPARQRREVRTGRARRSRSGRRSPAIARASGSRTKARAFRTTIGSACGSRTSDSIATPKSATGGSGIGLSVVRELVTLHGGRTRAEGAPGGGARVVIELPLAQSEPNEPSARATHLTPPCNSRRSHDVLHD